MLKEVSIIQADVKNYTAHLLGKNDISLFTSMSIVIGIDYYLLTLKFLAALISYNEILLKPTACWNLIPIQMLFKFLWSRLCS